jgi:hypothetical protein
LTKHGECIHCGAEAEICIDCGVLNEVMDEAVMTAAKAVRDAIAKHVDGKFAAWVDVSVAENFDDPAVSAIVRLALDSPRLTPPARQE